MDRRALLELVELLGKEFERREMRSHLETLRLYYVALQKHLDRRGSVRVAWDEEMTIEWLGMLRVPPHDQRYPVRPREYRCMCTAPARSTGTGDWSHIGKGSAATLTVFPGGYLTRCNDCDAKWLVLDAPAGADATSGWPPTP
jgi:hypothetical protein